MTSQNNANTVFLTEEESDRIRNTVKDRLKKCSKLEGHARDPRDSKDAISQATGASLMADMGTSTKEQAGSLPALGIGQPYPPCIISLQDLQPITLAELRIDIHHHGRRLALKRVSPVVTLAARSWTMVQDEKGDTERLEVYLHKSRHGEDVLESASVFVIKEPYFTLTDQGEATLRIDHPSDLVVCGDETAYTSLTSTNGVNGVNGQTGNGHTENGHTSNSRTTNGNTENGRTENGNAENGHTDNGHALNGRTSNGQGGKDDTGNGHTENGHAEDSAAVEKKARTCKDQGNIALKKQDLPLAHAKYTEALKIARQDAASDTIGDLTRDIFRNRAHVNLLLYQLDEAKLDAKASLIGRDNDRSKELDSKANFRAGCAAYNLGEYQEAKGFFEEQQKLMPGDKTASVYLRNIDVRLREQETGTYNFKKIKAGLSRVRPRVDAANFINNTEVKDSVGRGRGLFATRQIPAGEIVMCEKAFCVVWGHENDALAAMTYDVRDDKIRMSPVGLSKAIVQKLLSNPSQIEKVLNLYGDYHGDGKNVSRTDEGAVVDTFRVHDIMSRNAFGLGNQYGEEGVQNPSTGLWVWAAYINHSCIANAKKEHVGDLMVLRATRSLSAGEEIFISYDWSGDYGARQTALMNTWGFECTCTLCVAEKADDPALRKKRLELATEADAFVEREHWADVKRLTIVKAQRLARAIDDTYDAERYKDVPRVATLRILEWLAKASPRR